MAIGGAQLALLHGSVYYLLAGVALIAIGVLFWLRFADAALAYGLFLLATIVWAVLEPGFFLSALGCCSLFPATS
ncbi:hypothetical protein [Sphingomonas sp.]|uniref:hypothetical protein n=1 Tax=Sphingomonas sp. TaxID=28214 RepID=UPI003AFF9176